MSRKGLAGAVVSGCLVVAACALPSADEYASSAREAQSDGGRHDEAGNPIPMSTDSSDSGTALEEPPDATVPLPDGAAGPPDLLAGAGTFENASSCVTANRVPPKLTQASGMDSQVARSGARSCELCRRNQASSYAFDQAFATATASQMGKTYHAEAWVRRADGQTTPQLVTITLRTTGVFPFEDDDAQSRVSTLATLSGEWQKLSVDLTIREPYSSIDAFVTARPTGATNGDVCILIDDFFVWQSS